MSILGFEAMAVAARENAAVRAVVRVPTWASVAGIVVAFGATIVSMPPGSAPRPVGLRFFFR